MPSSTVVSSTERRPTRSATGPQVSAPTNMPTNAADRKSVASVPVGRRPYVATRPGSTNPARRTSIASAAQVSPPIARSLHWKGPRPMASMASSTPRASIVCVVAVIPQG